METASQSFGSSGEDIACARLAEAGYKVLLRNYECALGEIDIIAKHQGMLVFIEVKARRSLEAGWPQESVTRQKRRQIVKAALYYLKRYGILDTPCRFDVVSVFSPPEGPLTVEIIENAFREGE